MFTDVGKKLMAVIKILVYVGVAIAFITGIAIAFQEASNPRGFDFLTLFLDFFVISILLPVCIWIGSWVMFIFAENNELLHKIVDKQNAGSAAPFAQSVQSAQPFAAPAAPAAQATWTCPTCGTANDNNDFFCRQCGKRHS